ncbi:MAG: RNA 2',3'-cyclic phosphodiesterase [Candidatus Riflebacteria bacterium]|nr:RNA 2',3'-cyclic phosphodiesterase [Candidatus Riflebacteria bacterium]
MNQTIRLFFAVEVPEETRNEIAKFGETLDRCWKPSRPGQLHITLSFMGTVAPDDLAKVIQIGEEAAQKLSGFPVSISDTAVFPETGEPRVLYAQIDGGRPLLDLAGALRQQLADMADQKKIKPHLTLARSHGNRPARKVLRKFKGSWQVTDFVLFKSVLSPDGITHEPLQRFKLTAPVL